jgi:endonuclease/exonuclease/phosphatase family metal-dependent hydrolase
VVTYNIWGLPSPLLRHGERFEDLPEAINALDADVVLVQEAFTSKAQALTHLSKFPYFAWGPKARFLHFSSGLLILSRYPIDETARITYSRCGGFDCFANKGALYARIQVPGAGPVSVFNTHLNANGYEAARVSQAAHLLRFVQAYARGLPTVVGGDFNGDGQSLFQKAWRKTGQALFLRDAHADYVDAHPAVSASVREAFTADPVHNPFLGHDETRRRLDHLYMMQGKALDYGLLFDGVHGEVLSDHFGVRATLDLTTAPRS